MKLLLGAGILDFLSALIPSIIVVITTTFVWLMNSVLTALRKIRHILFSAIVGTMVCVFISHYLSERYNMNGASYALVIAQSAQLLIMVIVIMNYFISGKSKATDWKANKNSIQYKFFFVTVFKKAHSLFLIT